MFRYILNRTFQLIPTLFGVVTLVFFFIHLVPGDPIDILLGEQAVLADKEAMKVSLGLNLPVHEQYIQFLNKLMHMDLGVSFLSEKPVIDMILSRIPSTFMLAVVSILFALLFSFVLGLISAFYEDKWQDKTILVYTSLLFSMPSFWVGPLLLIVFSVWLDLVPVGGQEGWETILLPAFTLSMGMTAMTSRLIRTSVLEKSKEDYMQTALSKGLSKQQAFFKHALKNALLPVVTVVFLQAGVLLTGAILVETIFSWNGIGLLLVEGLNQRDYPVVQGCILFIASMYMLMTFISDIIYAFIDPRIRLGGHV